LKLKQNQEGCLSTRVSATAKILGISGPSCSSPKFQTRQSSIAQVWKLTLPHPS